MSKDDAEDHTAEDAAVSATQGESAAFVTGQVFDFLHRASRVDAQAVAWACYEWLGANEAGAPQLGMVDGKARDDARFWAETAHLGELECYVLAGVDKLLSANPAFASRQIKRLAGKLWRRMSPTEKQAYLEWMAK